MKESGVPMYLKVASTIKSRVHSRVYQPGEWIPPARDLAKEFGVSIITIRKAVELLIGEGYLFARQGAGTMVTVPEMKKVEIRISGNFRDWLDSASGRSPQLDVQVLDTAEFHPPESIRAHLCIGREESVGRVRRLRRYQGEIVSYFINYFRSEHLQQMPAWKFSGRPFVEVFQESLGIRFKHLDQRVEAVIADMDLAEVLETDYGFPLFFVENIYYSTQNKPVVVTHMYYRGDRYVYKASIPLNVGNVDPRCVCVEPIASAADSENRYADDNQ
jgi:GntR family transcriptional regulator